MKAELHEHISQMVEEFNPETRIIKCTGYHGTNKGEEETIMQFYDPHRHEWTTAERALEGYIIKTIRDILYEIARNEYPFKHTRSLE